MRFKGFNIPRPSFSFRVTWGEGKWRIKLSPYTYEHPRPSVTVDLVIFSSRPEGVNILLIQRGREPFKDDWALPGGFIDMDESLEQSARRELVEETGLEIDQVEQLGAYGDPKRDPRGRVISIAYWTLLPPGATQQVKASDDASRAEWFPVSDLPNLAFDHASIIRDAIKALQEQD
jgi:8-oxo-dGTP diphosphatase